jgi:hypothetical protein
MVKIGIDFHGVITDYPIELSRFAGTIIAGGGEVHIMTGATKEKFAEELMEVREGFFPHTHFFSISDYHLERNPELVDVSNPDFPRMDDHLWDATKAIYAKEVGIDMMIDDSPRYGKFFEDIPYLLMRNEKTSIIFSG